MKKKLPPQSAVQVTAAFSFLLLWISNPGIVFSQAQLVKDLNKSEYRHFNEYTQLTNAHGGFYFVSNGKELWKSDGTTAGTKRVRALRGIQNLTLLGNTLYFSATDESAAELWKSDGTYGGTVRVKQIRQGSDSGSPKEFTVVNGTVYFVADNGMGYELWKTNGTTAGTVLVKDIRTGSEGSEPSYLTAVNEILYFSADDGIHGRELWRSDGTANGTKMLKDIEIAEGESGEIGSSEPKELVALNGFLFFSAKNSVSGRELWRSDGTASGTIQLKDINPGSESAEIGSIRRMGNAIYFNAKSEGVGTALWRSSGTTAGTVMVKDLTDDDSELQVQDMTVLNNRLYWLLGGYAGHQVWVSNGTAAGTIHATTFDNRDTPAQFTFMNNKIYYFSAYWSQDPYAPFQQLSSINPDGSGWREIWKMETPFTVGGEEDEYWYDFSMDLVAFNNSLIFPGVRNEIEGYKLLQSNGTVTPPVVLVDTYRPTQGSAPNTMVKSNSYVYFLSQGFPGENQHVWRTDGTEEGTLLLKSSPGVRQLMSVNNTTYFSVWGYDPGFEIWKTDGTTSGTTLLKTFDHYSQLVNVAGTLYIYNDAGEVWRSDGTSAGTILLKKFPSIEHLAASGSIAYILVRTTSGGQELWKSNGQPAGTVKVRTIRWTTGPWTANHNTSATLASVFYFVGDNGTHGRELWRSDGTASGTYMVKDIRKDDTNELIPDIWRITAFNNALFINAMDGNNKLVLFKSDGTYGGTKKIYDSDRISEFMPYGDQLLFLSEQYFKQSLFSTDGTTEGTNLLQELPYNQGWWVSYVEMNGLLYFSYLGSDVLWRTDGTECGTVGISLGVTKVDNPMPANSNLLLFSARHQFYGEELFSINVDDLHEPSCPDMLASGRQTSTQMSSDEPADPISYGPNPFDSNFMLTISSNVPSTAEVAVYDMAGHPVTLDVLETNKGHEVGNNWREGVYILRIVFGGKTTYSRVIKGRR